VKMEGLCEVGLEKAERPCLIFAVGNPDENHSWALPRYTDSIFATLAALKAARLTGAYYGGHIPYTTDGGDLAASWSRAYLPKNFFCALSAAYLRPIVDGYRELLKKDVEVVIAVGHGGIPAEFASVVERELEVKTTCVYPGKNYGMHSGDEEHSLMKYLGYYYQKGEDLIHRVAAEDPEKVLKICPTLLGLSGYWALGEYSIDRYGSDFQALGGNEERRKFKGRRVDCFLRGGYSVNSITEEVEYFERGRIYANPEHGKVLYEGFVDGVVSIVEGEHSLDEEFAKEVGGHWEPPHKFV